MAVYRNPFVAREGWPIVASLAVVAGLVWHFGSFVGSAPIWVMALVVAFLFRDPDRQIPSAPLAVVSPADGEVVAIEQTRGRYLDRDCVRISIRMSVLGVYSTRSPVEGKILEIPQTDRFNPGMPNGVWVQTDQKDDVVVVMNRGRLHTAPRCYVRIGERVGQGQRCGFVHLGSLVDVYVPANTRINVKPGDRVQAGSTVVATLVRK